MSRKIYWGDIHNHCNIGYAKGSLERAYDIAQSHLDFYCFTPHSQWHDQPRNNQLKKFTAAYEIVKRNWDKIQRYANESNKPGCFVSFIGYEWHSSSCGDVCIIMPGSDGDLIYPESLEDLQAFARENKALLIPHHPAYKQGWRGQNWELLGAVDISPVVEIFSEHGNAESDRAPFRYIRHSMGGRYTRNTVQYLWSRGNRLGVIGGTDDHLGYPGAYGEGLTAVYSDALTRESIVDAIAARRTYAVSADRMELDFRLNGHCMGEELPAVSSRNIYAKVKGLDVIDRIEILRNNEVIHRHYPVDNVSKNAGWNKPVICRVEFGWGPWDGLNQNQVTDWDIDIKVANGKMLNAVPCFQSGPYDEKRRNKIVRADENLCRLISYTSRKQAFEERATNAVTLEIQGTSETEMLLSISQPAEIEIKKTLGDLAESNDMFFTGMMPSESVMLHRVVFEENYGAEFEFSDTRESNDTDWYYIRAVQMNGSLAWSSPIWIEGKSGAE